MLRASTALYLGFICLCGAQAVAEEPNERPRWRVKLRAAQTLDQLSRALNCPRDRIRALNAWTAQL